MMGKELERELSLLKFLNIKEKSRIQHICRENKLLKEKNLCKRGFFGGSSKHS